MTTTTTTALADKDLALAKARAGLPLTDSHKRLVVLELARRAHLADTDTPTNGQEWAILRRVANCPSVVTAFLEVVQAYDDWQSCEANVDAFRCQVDEPMSRGRAYDYTLERLSDSVNALLGLAAVNV